jgi:hypothetical protein
MVVEGAAGVDEIVVSDVAATAAHSGEILATAGVIGEGRKSGMLRRERRS